MPMEGEGEDTVVYNSTQSSNFLRENSFPFPRNPFPVLHRVLVLLLSVQYWRQRTTLAPLAVTRGYRAGGRKPHPLIPSQGLTHEEPEIGNRENNRWGRWMPPLPLLRTL